MAARAVKCAASVAALLGEGPLWDPRIGRLLFLDIKDSKLFLYDPKGADIETHSLPVMVSALGLRRQGGYVCAHRGGFAFLNVGVDGVEVEEIVDPEADRPGNRFNDGKVDPFGGFWAGTMDDRENDDEAGSWWRLAPDLTVSKIDAGFHVTNGPAFDSARNRVYFTDSARRRIFAGDLVADGFKNKRVFLEFDERSGFPDGMEVGAEGDLWVAFWDGAAVRRFSPEADPLEAIVVPAPRPTSIAFEGRRAYVTSARIGLDAGALEKSPDAGALFEIGPGAPSNIVRYFEG